ncbi:uncharacterized protein LOC117109393 [Anneissia japonica]|uniref:uncharacterized protein LOC117109393 n=1 Tax=Anneissia japonica TaxID=1529436 RepID=UPI0014255E47|nr:uncharacterized protein LOC117109393 [Anneissia japonica]
MLPKRNKEWNDFFLQNSDHRPPVEQKVSFRLQPVGTKASDSSAATVSTRPDDRPSGKLRFGPLERSRIKELRNYDASTMLKNFQLPLIFRKQYYQSKTTYYPPGFLPPIHSASKLRSPLAKTSKVVSIPPVERRATGFKSLKCRLEAKGVHVNAPGSDNETRRKINDIEEH